ncbi:MAG: hypothetical protein CMJ23_04560 [Phycisphaerae bacterium]|nr:hypothetical protein [Phycisphaerae bacterium]
MLVVAVVIIGSWSQGWGERIRSVARASYRSRLPRIGLPRRKMALEPPEWGEGARIPPNPQTSARIIR